MLSKSHTVVVLCDGLSRLQIGTSHEGLRNVQHDQHRIPPPRIGTSHGQLQNFRYDQHRISPPNLTFFPLSISNLTQNTPTRIVTSYGRILCGGLVCGRVHWMFEPESGTW